jgi:hypothetical protein
MRVIALVRGSRSPGSGVLFGADYAGALCRAMTEGSRYRKRRPAGKMAERARAAPVVAPVAPTAVKLSAERPAGPDVKYPRIEE